MSAAVSPSHASVKASYRAAVETSTATSMKSSPASMKSSPAMTATLRKDRQWQKAEADKYSDYAENLDQCAILHCGYLCS
jgi:hypothetical protein